MISFAVHSYLISNLLLIFSWIFFFLSSQLLDRLKITFKKVYLLRISQFLVFAAVTLGCLVPHLPFGIKLHGIELNTSFLETIDERVSQSSTKASSEKLVLKSNDLKNNPSKSLHFDRNLAKQVTIAFFLIGLIYQLGKFLLNGFCLLTILQNGTRFKKIGKTEILVSEQALVPFATRLFMTAHIIIPIRFLELRQDLKIAIQHELQHHRNQDTLWILWMELLKILFYCNPAVYFWRKKIDDLLEFACDEVLVLRSKVTARDYGNCLIGLAEILVQSHKSLAGTTGMASSQANSLTKRIQELFDYKEKDQNNPNGIRSALFVLFASNSLLLVTALIANGSSETLSLPLPQINSSIQNIANHALLDGIQKSSAENGYAIVVDPGTGDILALSFCSGLEKSCLTSQDASKIITKKLIQPASLIKPLITYYAVNQGYIQEQKTLEGSMTPSDVIIQSSQNGIIEIAKKLNHKGLKQSMIELGINRSNSYSISLSDFAMGKNIYFSPIEIVGAYRKVLQNSDKNSGRNSQWIKTALAHAVTKGTGSNAKSSLYSTGGKTGTAYAYEAKTKRYLKDLGEAQFIGFAPVQKPRALVYVVIESPEGSSVGNDHAAPVFKNIIDETLTHLKIEPDLGNINPGITN